MKPGRLAVLGARWRRAVPLGALLAVAGCLAPAWAPVRAFEEQVGLQILFRLRGPRRPPPEVVVVAIADESASALGLVADPRRGAGPGPAGARARRVRAPGKAPRRARRLGRRGFRRRRALPPTPAARTIRPGAACPRDAWRRYERLARGRLAPGLELLLRSATHRLPLRPEAFRPNGLFAGLLGTFVRQDGVFLDARGRPFAGRDAFWLFDASFGYRLPAPRGLLAVEIPNVLDTSFRDQDTDPAGPTIAPRRRFLLRLTLAF